MICRDAEAARTGWASPEGGYPLPKGGYPLPKGGYPLPEGGSPQPHLAGPKGGYPLAEGVPEGGYPLPEGGSPQPHHVGRPIPLRWLSLPALGLLLACAPAPGAPAAPTDRDTPASAAAPWVSARRPSDATLLTLPATVHGAAAAQGVVVAPGAARVQAVTVQVGDAVTAGQPVVVVRVPELVTALARADAAGRQLRPVQARLTAVRGLRRDGLAAGDAVFALEAEAARLEAARAEAEATLVAVGLTGADRERLRAEGLLSLRAPVAGTVVAVQAPLGAVLGPEDAPLVRLQGLGPARVRAVSPGPLPAGLVTATLVTADGGRVALTPTPVATLPQEDGPGWVFFFNASEPLPNGLRGTLHLGLAPDASVEVPRAAVYRVDGAAFVALEGAGVAAREGAGEPARAGAAAARWIPVQVLSGSGTSAWVVGALQAGDRVAADARRLVAAGALAAPAVAPEAAP